MPQFDYMTEPKLAAQPESGSEHEAEAEVVCVVPEVVPEVVQDFTIEGSGGGGSSKGGGSARTPVESADTLINEDYANVLLCVSEGQIFSWATEDYLQSIYLDDTPIRNPDGSLNFNNFDIDFVAGTPVQNKLRGSSAQSAVFNVNTKVTTNFPVSYTVTDPETDAIVVNIATPSFKQVNAKTGDIVATYAAFNIFVSSAGGPFILQRAEAFSGKSAGAYSQDYTVNLQGSAPWIVRVSRVTPDSTSDKLLNDIYFQRITEVKYTANTYNNRAMLYAGFPAQYFSTVPKVSVKIRGVVVYIPHNYNPFTATYSGLFNGTLIPAWTDNPAWILFDLLNNGRYGVGIPAPNLDVYSFYSLAQYCDELVSDGLGGLERRYTFNSYITNKTDAYTLLNSVAASMRCSLTISQGVVKVLPERLKNPTKLFNKANVVVGEDSKPPFRYQTTPLSQRYNVVNVTWFDKSDNYRPKTETVQDTALIGQLGHNSTDITVMGCTSRGQAIRHARWVIYTSCYQTKVVEFDIDSQGLDMTPGEVVLIQDELYSNKRISGRVVDSNGSFITIDSEVDLVAGQEYQIIVEDRSFNIYSEKFTASTTTTTNQIPSGLVPPPNSPWALLLPTQGEQYWITSITENEDKTYTVAAAIYNPEKYSLVENFSQSNLINRIFSGYTQPLPPINISVNESLYIKAGTSQLAAKLNILWGMPSGVLGVVGFEVGYKPSTEANWTVVRTSFLSIDIFDLLSTSYDIRIRALSKSGNPSAYSQIRYTVEGLARKPSNVSNFRIISDRGNSVLLGWSLPSAETDLDVLVGGRVEIRHYSSEVGAVWDNSTILAYAAGNQNTINVPRILGTYLVKFVDSNGNYSLQAVGENTSILSLALTNVVSQVEDTALFPGVREGVRKVGSSIQLAFDDIFNGTDIFNSTDIFNASGSDITIPEGYYNLSSVINVGDIYDCSINTSLIYNTFDTQGVFNSSEVFNSLEVFNDLLVNATVSPQISVSDDGINYTTWRDFYTGTYKGKFFKFRLHLKSSNESANVAVTTYKIEIDMPDRDESGTLTSNTLSDTMVSFNSQFKEPPSVVVSIQNQLVGDYAVINSITASSFQVGIYNSSGSRINRQFSWLAKGYGRVVI